MTTLTGHLTATEKKHIKAILSAGLSEGRVNRKDYRINRVGDVFEVLITAMETAWCETVPRLITNKHTFKM
ncbi:MAG: hypothetical protein V4721_10355 [Bacteroidota bacterium]